MDIEQAAIVAYVFVQWNLSVTTTFIINCVTCDLFSNVF